MFIKGLSILVSIIFVVAIFTDNAKAKSVHAITDHGYGDGYGVPAKIAAYGIEGNQIDEQYVYELPQGSYPDGYPTGANLGPVGITSGDGYLFVTHENTQGGIDVREVRQAITDVMEGGEKAFRLRYAKYGF